MVKLKLRCSIEKEVFQGCWRETRSLLYVIINNGNKNLIVTKTRDQPEPGSFFPCSLWGGEMKDDGNEVVL